MTLTWTSKEVLDKLVEIGLAIHDGDVYRTVIGSTVNIWVSPNDEIESEYEALFRDAVIRRLHSAGVNVMSYMDILQDGFRAMQWQPLRFDGHSTERQMLPVIDKTFDTYGEGVIAAMMAVL